MGVSYLVDAFFPGGSKRGGFMARWGLRLFPSVDENLEKNARL